MGEPTIAPEKQESTALAPPLRRVAPGGAALGARGRR
jgi:hypothetical protein